MLDVLQQCWRFGWSLLPGTFWGECEVHEPKHGGPKHGGVIYVSDSSSDFQSINVCPPMPSSCSLPENTEALRHGSIARWRRSSEVRPQPSRSKRLRPCIAADPMAVGAKTHPPYPETLCDGPPPVKVRFALSRCDHHCDGSPSGGSSLVGSTCTVAQRRCTAIGLLVDDPQTWRVVCRIHIYIYTCVQKHMMC